MEYVKNRLREPSTWIGVGLIVQGVARYLSGDKWGGVEMVAGALGVHLREAANG